MNGTPPYAVNNDSWLPGKDIWIEAEAFRRFASSLTIQGGPGHGIEAGLF
jgi:hypothetical protein